jgi:hypothetical protein
MPKLDPIGDERVLHRGEVRGQRGDRAIAFEDRSRAARAIGARSPYHRSTGHVRPARGDTMTKQDLIARMQRLIEEGSVPVHAVDNVRLDEMADAECIVDMFGEATAGIDLELERFFDAQPTGHRRWDSSDDRAEHFIDSGYILD